MPAPLQAVCRTVEKLLFILMQYASLVIFAGACYGLGRWATLRAGIEDLPRIFNASLALCAGMGIGIVGLQILGVLGYLRPAGVLGLVAVGLAGLVALVIRRPLTHRPLRDSPNQSVRWIHFLVPTAIAVELFLRPLMPPEAWDELMYHLPHARDWVLAGQLQVNEWLRYPLFPYNFNLLFAAGLVMGSDVFPHMVHAFAGALVIAAMYGAATHYFGRTVAAIAILLFVALVKVEFGNAYVDLGLTAFLFFSAACTLLWLERGHFRLICLASFLFGVAVGIKYQALLFAPFLFLAIIWKERRIRALAVLFLLFVVPCGYWYARSFWVSGDPFHPLGGGVFGYWRWDRLDMEYQVADIRRVFGWPTWHVWPAAGALALYSRWKEPAFRAVILFSAYAFAVWMLTSHYPRYLLPAYPFLCILAALVICDGIQRLLPALRVPISDRSAAVGGAALIILLMAILSAAVVSASRQWRALPASDDERAAYLRKKIRSYEVAEVLRERSGFRLVQIGLESDLYYLPPGTIGDVFGPGRYRDFLALESDQLAVRIKALGANALILSTSGEAGAISEREDFGRHFEIVVDTAGARLYAVK